MINHYGYWVTDYPRSLDFYRRLFAPFGYEFCEEIDPASLKPSDDDPHREPYFILKSPLAFFGHHEAGLRFGVGRKPQHEITQGHQSPPVFCSFRATGREMVDAFFKAGIDAGAGPVAEPALRKSQFGDMYSACIRDTDGHEVEAVFWL